MRTPHTLRLVTFVILALCCSPLVAQINVGISADEGGVKGFYLAVGQYYHVPEREVVVVRERRIPDDELPVVFFVASRAHVAPSVIVDLRLSGKSWWDISARYGIGPEAYYVPVNTDPGPPYGRAYGYYKHKPRREWRSIVLADDDIVNFVNLRFASDHYRCSPDEVMKLRSSGRSFVAIHDEVRHGNHGRGHGEGKGASKGKGKGKRKW